MGANLCDPLQVKARDKGAFDKEIFHEFTTFVEKLDYKRHLEREEIDRRILAVNTRRTNSSSNPSSTTSTRTAHLSKSSTATIPSYNFSPPFYEERPDIPCIALSAMSSSIFTPGQSTAAPPPKLTDKEKKILDDNEGCRKCRKVRQKHVSEHCPNDIPSGDGYKLVCYKATSGSSSTAPTSNPSSKCTSSSSDSRPAKRPKQVSAINEDGSEDNSDLPVCGVDFGDTSVSSTTLSIGGRVPRESQLPLLSVSAINARQFL